MRYTLIGRGADKFIKTGAERETFATMDELLSHAREVIIELAQSWRELFYRSQNEYKRELSEEFFSLIEEVEEDEGDFTIKKESLEVVS